MCRNTKGVWVNGETKSGCALPFEGNDATHGRGLLAGYELI